VAFGHAAIQGRKMSMTMMMTIMTTTTTILSTKINDDSLYNSFKPRQTTLFLLFKEVKKFGGKG
jgi:hypothetical protein